VHFYLECLDHGLNIGRRFQYIGNIVLDFEVLHMILTL